jgi:hypothetical protein
MVIVETQQEQEDFLTKWNNEQSRLLFQFGKIWKDIL